MNEPTTLTAAAATPTSNSTSTIQVRLTTRTETPISSTPIVIPTNVTRYSLSQILNHLLENPSPIPYSFLINSTYLPSTLDEYITSHSVSREEVLEIEYVRSVLPPKWEGRWNQEDWVGGVSVRDSGVVSGGYDGVVRVWDWSGNVLVKKGSSDGALRPVKCVKWIDGGLVSGGMDGSVRVWGYEDGALFLNLEGKGHEASVDSVDYRDGKIISASADGSLKLWSSNASEGEAAEESSTKRKRRRTDTSHPTKVLSTSNLLIVVMFGNIHSCPRTSFDFNYFSSCRLLSRIFNIPINTSLHA
jgi:ribosome biogenesis protein